MAFLEGFILRLPQLLMGSMVFLCFVLIGEGIIYLIRMFGRKWVVTSGPEAEFYPYRALISSFPVVIRYGLWSFALLTVLPIFQAGDILRYFIAKLWSSIPLLAASVAIVFFIHLFLPVIFPSIIAKTRHKFKKQKVRALIKGLTPGQLDQALIDLEHKTPD